MRGHQDSVHSAELLMFSNIVLSSSVDKTLMLWDARTVIHKINFIHIKTKVFLGFSRAYICRTC
jgi:WD40 repeat protein